MKNYYLGCDVSKGYADFVIIDEKKRIVEPDFQIDDTFDGHQLLFKILEKFCNNHPTAVIYAAVESTGGYENNWFQALRRFNRMLPIEVARVNPIGVNHSSKAAMMRVTNDKTSAYSIAEYQIHHPEKLYYNQDDEFKTLKRMFTATRMMVKSKTQFLNELETLLYSANPELEIYRKENTPRWLLLLLQLYPDARSLAAASVDDLVKIPYLAPGRAQEIINAAKQSVASATDEITQITIQSMVSAILNLETLIKKNVKIIQKEMCVPQVKLLCTLKSLGMFSAIGLLIEIGCIERFPTVKHLVSFFGLHPIFKESGDGKSGVRMSKQGRKKPRAILFMVALNAIQSNPLIRELYHREMKKGKAKMAAIGVCMHKILRIIYGMLKNNTEFDPEIDRRNSEKFVPKKKKLKTNTKRRFQKQDPKAPISRKQTQKRKERELSQSEFITKSEISVPAPSGV